MAFKQGNLAMRLLFSLILSLLFLQVARAQAPLIPEELREFAKENGCSPIEDFYEHSWNFGQHPYVYGYLPGPQEESAVLWCRGLEEGKGKLFLLLMFENTQHESARCPHKIEWKNSGPLGLSVYTNQETDLEEFVYHSNPRQKGPKDKMTNNAILDEYDGVAHLFYCHKGEWLVRFRH